MYIFKQLLKRKKLKLKHVYISALHCSIRSWVLRLQKLEPEPPADAESSGGGKGTIARDSSTYLFIGTKQCNFHIPKGQFIGSEMTLKSVGRKHNWMSDPMAVFYSQPFYQGKSVTIRYFKDGSWAKPGNDVANFYPKSSIVVNSNWNIEKWVNLGGAYIYTQKLYHRKFIRRL